MLLKDYIVGLMPTYMKDYDSYKDLDGKGFVERYLEIFGMELDEFYYPKIEAMINEVNPLTAQSGFLDYIAYAMGDIDNITSNEDEYRRFISFVISIFKVKGRFLSYQAILYPLHVVATAINEIPVAVVRYDSGLTYDQVGIAYDQGCPTCSDYELTMTSDLPLTSDLYNRILSAIAIVEPINAKLTKITFNGDDISEVVISVEVDEFGDLVYDNAEDPDLVLTLDEDGNLIISGPNSTKYFINSDGDLVYLST